MTVSTANATAAELVNSLANASPDQIEAEFVRVTKALWDDGTLTELALPTVPVIVERLARTESEPSGHLALLLGLLAEADSGGEVFAAVRRGLDDYLRLVRRCSDGGPSALAMVYLLAQFPADRDRILAAVRGLSLGEDDLSRLDRALQTLNPAAPDLGRVWPSPSTWTLNDAEREFDQEWIRILTPEQIRTNWSNDTRTVLGYAGAKARWALQNGAPSPPSGEGLPPRPPAGPGERNPGAGTDLFGPHAPALRCPACGGGLEVEGGARCAGCGTTYPVADGILDLSSGGGDGTADEATAGLLQKLAEMPTMGLFYEALLRPAFLRIAGSNWDGAITHGIEDRYIAEHIDPVDGPVLDLAAGAGRWTTVVADAVGADRLIAVDLGVPMLTVLRRKLPDVPAVLASALDLPLGDGTLGAVNCWNALQAFPDDAATAIAEIGRVLRPGGTFTMMTFLWSEDPVYRYFQACHYFPSRPAGMLLFEHEEIRRWVADAGMTVRHEWLPGSFVFLTAERT